MIITLQMINEYLKECREIKLLDAKTVKAYRIDLRQFMKYAAVQNVELDRDAINDYLKYMNAKYKPSTVKRKIASLRALCTYLEEKEEESDNPFIRFHLKLNEPEVLPKTIAFRIIKELIDAVHQQHRKKQSCVRNAAVLEMLFATGVRVSELCELQTENVNLLDGIIKVNGKGKRERLIHIANREVLETLRQYVQTYQPDKKGSFFLNRHMRQLSTQSVRNMICKYVDKIGLSTRITPHMFRHSLATLLLEEGVDIRYIQRLLGHSSILTTEIYTHVDTSKQREIMSTKHPRNKISVFA